MTRHDMPEPHAVVRALFWLTATRRGYVEVTPDRVEVRLGLAFRAAVARSSVAGVAHDTGRVSGIGAHGWAGRWLVNTTTRGLVRLEVSPTARGRVLGFPVRIRRLRLSLVDPDAFVRELSRGLG